MRAKKRNILLIAVLIIISSGVLYFLFMSHKESVYQERYSELYYLEDYLQGIKSRNDLCESLQYNSDGSETYFGRHSGIEESIENNMYTSIELELEYNGTLVTYDFTYVIEKENKKWLGRYREMNMNIYIARDNDEIEYTQYYIKYNYESLEFSVMQHYKNEEIASEFDEEGQKVYDLIIEDITNRIEQCK